MVTTVTDNSPQSINTSLFSLDKEVQEVKKTADALNDKLSGIDTESGVISVNGKQGIVELDASDVGALPNTTVIPTTTSELTNNSGFITINDVGSSFVPVTRKVNNKALDKDISLTASDVGALPSSGLSTKFFTKDDNNGLPVYHIMYDCTDIVTAESGARVVGFEGIAVDTRYGGYPIESTQAITAVTGWSNAFLLLRHSCLTETSILIIPVILKHTEGSSTKYYIALRVHGSGRQIRLFGHFMGEYIGTNILALDSNGALPYGYELYKSSELGGRVKYADRAEYGTFGMLGGANQAVSNNFDDLLNNELCSNTSGGLRGGSIATSTESLGIGAGWYNFLYIPHRSGAGSDNYMYGTLFVTPMTSNSNIFYIIHRISGHNYNAFTYAGS